MPATAQNTYSNVQLVPMYEPTQQCQIHVALKASAVYPKGAILGEVTATLGTAALYASGNADGSQVAKYIMPIDAATDASGNITVGSQTAGAAPFGVTYPTVQVYVRGTFKTAELKQTAGAGQVDANAITNLGGRLYNGTVADGTVHIP